MRRFFTAVAIALSIGAALVAQSTSTPPRITIVGRAIADDTGDPIPNARVTASPTTGSPVVVLADAEGGFTLRASTRPLRIEVSKTGFATATIALTETDSVREIHLRRSASLSGRIIDTYGQAVVDALVAVESVNVAAGSSKVAKAIQTDDRGEYRVGGLGAGDVLVSVTTIDGLPRGSGMRFEARPHKTYFPDAATPADAQPVHLTFGEERPSVDVVVGGDQTGGQPFFIGGGGPAIARRDPLANEPAIFRGQVVDVDGRGLARAFVRLFALDSPFGFEALRADADGRFEFADLAIDRFRVTVFVPGYTVAREENALILPSIPQLGLGIPVGVAQTRDSMTIVMSRLGVLAGRVVDELGDPVEGARVQLMTIKYQQGRRRMVEAGLGVRMTNDRGEYRLHDTPPGRYLVSVSIGAVGSADVPGYARTYFPGTPNPAEAQFVALDQADRLDVNVALVRTPTALVSGHIYGANGEPTTRGHVELRPTARSGAVGIPVGARLRQDGAFEFPNVSPGEYVIEADHGKSNESSEGEFGTTIVNVAGSDVTNVIVQMSAGSSVAGRIVLDTDDPTKTVNQGPIRMAATGVNPDRTPSKVADATVNADGTFAMSGLNGPRRLDLTSVPPGWMLKEIRVRGVDVTDRPLMFGRPDQSLTDVEVVLTDRLTRLSGSATLENGRQVIGSVIVFSTDRDRWYPTSRFLRQTFVAPGGVFVLTALPPGTYYAVAVARLPADSSEAWQDPEYLETLISSAKGLTISDGEQQTLDLRLGSR